METTEEIKIKYLIPQLLLLPLNLAGISFDTRVKEA